MSMPRSPKSKSRRAQHDGGPASAGRATLAIDGELTIYRAAELRTVLIAALADGGDLEVDLSAVTEMDSAGVQLLMAAKKTASASQRALSLVGHSPAVLEVFETLELAGHFGDPLLMPATAH